MLNIRGAFLVVKESGVEPHILSASALDLFMDRVEVVGFTKANIQTFGTDTLFSLPAALACMVDIMENYPKTGIHCQKLKEACARVVNGKPFGDDLADGGLGVVADNNRPKSPKTPSGAKVRTPAQVPA